MYNTCTIHVQYMHNTCTIHVWYILYTHVPTTLVYPWSVIFVISVMNQQITKNITHENPISVRFPAHGHTFTEMFYHENQKIS